MFGQVRADLFFYSFLFKFLFIFLLYMWDGGHQYETTIKSFLFISLVRAFVRSDVQHLVNLMFHLKFVSRHVQNQMFRSKFLSRHVQNRFFHSKFLSRQV